jgi:hypothetical protein
MASWEERITQATSPAIANEHVLRYKFASPVIRQSAVWADLGCGTGVAAASAMGEPFAGRLILAEIDGPSLTEAAGLLGGDEVLAIPADLTSSADLARMREEIARGGSDSTGCITCFELIEHLQTFVPLLELLVEASESLGFTVFISVPNDAFWSLDNPHHQTMWSGEAFEEFRRNLPQPHLLANQFPLAGSCVQPVSEEALHQTHNLAIPVSSEGIPSHYLAVFGPRHDQAGSVAEALQTDLERQRSWERQREADLAYYRQVATDALRAEEAG